MPPAFTFGRPVAWDPSGFSGEKWKVAYGATLARREVDPFIGWLDSLGEWDGTECVELLLHDMFGAGKTPPGAVGFRMPVPGRRASCLRARRKVREPEENAHAMRIEVRGFGAGARKPGREAQAFTGRFSRLVSANGRNRRARTVEVELDEKTGSLHQLGSARERGSPRGWPPGASPAPKGHAVVRAPDNLNSERSAQVPMGVYGGSGGRWCPAGKKTLMPPCDTVMGPSDL